MDRDATMQLTLFGADEALETLADSWLGLQNRCGFDDNSNHFLRLAQSNRREQLWVACLHDGRPAEELQALVVFELQRSWAASKRTAANWIAEPGLDSTPLVAEQQLYSALNTLLREAGSALECRKLSLRHLRPGHGFARALLAVCEQLKLAPQVNSERRGDLCEIALTLDIRRRETPTTLSALSHSSLRSLP